MTIALGIAALALLLVGTALVLLLWPALGQAVLGEDPPQRESALDGLRGVLALLVVLHHTIIAHTYFGGHPWAAPPSHFDNQSGQSAVALFFMASAYLFWGRVVRGGGRLDWLAFYRGRVRRLVPMFAATLLLLFLVVAYETGFRLRVAPAELLGQLLRWMSFSLMDLPDINALPETWTIFSVTWTLRYEWLFYLTLPFFAYLYSAVRRPCLLYALAFLLAIGLGGLIMAAFFVTGALAVHGLHWVRARGGLTRWAVAGLGLVAGAVLVARFHDAYAPGPVVLLLAVFVAAVQAHGPWALLRWRPLRFLGHISYSMYLLHNPLIHIVATLGFGAPAFAGLRLMALYGAVLLIGALTIAASTVSFLLVERPFLSHGASPGTPPAAGAALP